MILFLDTTDLNSLHFACFDLDGEMIKEKNFKVSYEDSRKTLSFLDKFLGKKKSEIEKIYIVSGPGSFTGIRIGFSIALGLSTVFNLPVFALTKNQLPTKLRDLFKKQIKFKKISSNFDPEYGMEPNITIGKKNEK